MMYKTLIENCIEGESSLPGVDLQKVLNAIGTAAPSIQLDEENSILDDDVLDLVIHTVTGLSSFHTDYSKLAARLVCWRWQKNTPLLFSDCIESLGELIDPEIHEIVNQHKEELNGAIDHARDSHFDIFGLRTIEKGYLMKNNDKILELPQYMFMRVSLGIHYWDIASTIETYALMSRGYFIHATPTLFNSGRPTPQLSSCFLMQIQNDSIDGIFKTVKDTALISKQSGGIGISISNIRAKGSKIKGGGKSTGLTPMLKVFNSTARYVDQGGKRKGSFATFLEPWHADIVEWLELKRNTGVDELRARDLLYGLWMPDLFMRRVEQDDYWTLFCPHTCPGLDEVHGEEFEKLYTEYERADLGIKRMKATEIWAIIIKSQVETGTPYMMYKDAANRHSNHRHLGTIKTSNLCTEIVQYVSENETAVCTLGSVALPAMLETEKGFCEFNHEKLAKMVGVMVRNLNKVIDRSTNPVEEAKVSSERHRAVGIGVQGLADVFAMLELPFDSEEALNLDRDIFETIYFAALQESVKLAKQNGPYSTFAGSPVSQGELQYHSWGVSPSPRHDWESLKGDIQRYGVRNSLLVAPMPTATTAQILGNNECFEPFTSNIYTRRCLSGEYVVVNKHLVKKLEKLDLWNEEMRTSIIANNGSVQNIQSIPEKVKKVFKTVWEIRQKCLIDHSVARAPFIDQSQSLNAFIDVPTLGKVSSMHFYAWKKGLKTGMYYLRSKPAANAVKFTVDPRREECEACSA